MKTDTLEIDKQRLSQAIRGAYGVSLASITFLPQGEEAYTYVGQIDADQRVFIRVQPTANATNLTRVYPLLDVLHWHSGLSQVLAPYKTLVDSLSIEFDKYTVAVFPYIDGKTLDQQGTSEADIRAAATLLARLHHVLIDTAILRREDFANPFREPILYALDQATQSTTRQTVYQRYACQLLAAERADIITTLEHMAQLQTRAKMLVSDWVITHGDPNCDNFIKDQNGVLHLTDWGDLAIGPPERDLALWTGDGFAVFLQQYAQLQPSVSLHRDIFEFYFYRWSMQEIADYATRILFRQLGQVEDEHAWAELQDYLPIQHQAIVNGLEQVQVTMNRVLNLD